MSKIAEKDINKYKEIMKGYLGEKYIHPSEVTVPTFIVQNMLHYDEIGELIYIPYVATNIHAFYDNNYLQGFPKGMLTLIEAIVSHMDKDGFAFPSVERLSTITGLSRSTVISYIKSIANNNIKGKVLFYKQTIKRGKNNFDINLYYIPDSIVAFTDSDDFETDEDKLKQLHHSQTTDIFPDIILDEQQQLDEDNKLDFLL